MGHNTEIYSLSFNNNNDYAFLTGAAGGDVKLWDWRKLTQSVHEFRGHEKGVLHVEWNKKHSCLFASGGYDGKVVL